MTDDLERRLRAADPARSASVYQPADSLIQGLSEAAMNTTPTQQDPRRPRWVPAVAAAAAVAVLGVGAYAVATSDDSAAPPTALPSSMELTLPAAGVMASCVGYSVDILADMPTAFSGTAVDVDDDSVLLEVDTWYRGGDADTVELATADGETISLSDVVEFTEGERYLVTASETGTVNSCGFTSKWSPEMAADFDRAFAK
ncbi:MAG: hypothetical protein H0U51_03885 [Propionibacteriales bacterium]|nr:hypothetical protein [Propionibacteriales bacterium]